MDATATASLLVREFERQDAPKFGGQQPARRALARKLGVSPGTLKSAREGRLKRICVESFAALKREEMRRLNDAIKRSEHELLVARQIGMDPRSDEFVALEAAVEAARKVRGE